jgi:hypothetical protein
MNISMLTIFKSGLLVLLTTISISAFGQNTRTIQFSPQDSSRPKPVYKPIAVKKPKPLRTELSFGARLNTNGWGIYADKGWVKSEETKLSDQFYNLRFVELEFSEIKNPKEIRQTNSFLGSISNEKAKPYIYGKINNFYTFKMGYGFRRLIAGKPEPGSVSIHWTYIGGFSLGLLKPYYIDALVQQDNVGTLVRETIKYSDSTKEAFMNDKLIIGNAGFTKGLNEIHFIPGLHAKTGLHFDFAANKKTVLAVEMGISADIYTKNIEIMANQKDYPYVVNIYAGIQFGKRW